MSQESFQSLISANLDDVKNYLKSNQIRVCVIGIGRIGLPTALSFADAGLPTIGVDINSNLVQMINSKEYPLKDEPGFDKIFESVMAKNTFHATTNILEVCTSL